MSLGTVIAFVAGLCLFFGAIIVEAHDKTAFEAIVMYYHTPALVMVLGGSMASAFISYEARYVMTTAAMLGAPLRRNARNAS